MEVKLPHGFSPTYSKSNLSFLFPKTSSCLFYRGGGVFHIKKTKVIFYLPRLMFLFQYRM